MTRRKHEQNLDRDDEIFETAFTWIISKVLGSATLFLIVALAAQWGTRKDTTSTRVELHGEKVPAMHSIEQVALAKPAPQPREKGSLENLH